MAFGDFPRAGGPSRRASQARRRCSAAWPQGFGMRNVALIIALPLSA